MPSNGRYCSAKNCSNSEKKNVGTTFHRFPKDPELLEKWILSTRRCDYDRAIMWQYSLCDKHFESSQFMCPADKDAFKKHKRLIHNAIPTLFDIPNQPKSGTLPKKRKKTASQTMSSVKDSPVDVGLPNRETSIRCTLANLELLHGVLIDVTVSVSRSLTTGDFDDISWRAVDEFREKVDEMNRLAMEIKQGVCWVTENEEPVTKRKLPSSKSCPKRKKRNHPASSSGGEISDGSPVLDSTVSKTHPSKRPSAENKNVEDPVKEFTTYQVHVLPVIDDLSSERLPPLILFRETKMTEEHAEGLPQDSDNDISWSVKEKVGLREQITIEGSSQVLMEDSDKIGIIAQSAQGSAPGSYRFQCKTCMIRFKEIDILQGHIKYCGKPIPKLLKNTTYIPSKDDQAIKDNAKLLTNNAEKSIYKCGKCEEKFAAIDELCHHFRIHFPYKCAVCGAIFSQSKELAKHSKVCLHKMH